MIPIYIINYEPLKERKKYIDSKLRELKINAKFIIQKKGEYSRKTINKRYTPNSQIWFEKFKIMDLNTKFYKLSKASINLNINHYKIWKMILIKS